MGDCGQRRGRAKVWYMTSTPPTGPTSLIVRLASAIDELRATLGDFTEARVDAVTGEDARRRIDEALVSLRQIQAELERLFPLR